MTGTEFSLYLAAIGVFIGTVTTSALSVFGFRRAGKAVSAIAEVDKKADHITQLTNSSLTEVKAEVGTLRAEIATLNAAALAKAESREAPLHVPEPAVQDVHVVNPPSDPANVQQQEKPR